MDSIRKIPITRRAALVGGLAMLAVSASVIVPAQPQETIMTKRTVKGPQGKLAAWQSGSGGLPVLFLHGDSCRASQWDVVMKAIAAERETIAFDFRGHGDSEPAADGDYGFEGRAEDVAAIARLFRLGRFVIVAHSSGAAVALAFAARHEDSVAGILMVEPATDPRALPQEVRDGFVRDLAGPQSLEAQKTFYASIAGSDAVVRERVLADVEAVDPAARAGVGEAFATWNPEPTLNAYGGPMLVLVTQASDSPAALHRLRTDIPHRIVGDAGHWMHLDRPDALTAAINEFAARIEAGEAVQ
jgi:pimeloyl-ACP methyl ester carboxylesterase